MRYSKSIPSKFFLKNILSITLIFSFTLLSAQQDWIVTEVAALPVKVANNAVCEGFIDGIPYLFSFSGIDSTKNFSGIHLKSFRYNSETGAVLTLDDLPDNRGKIAAGASRIGDIIYIIGGYHVFSNNSEESSNKVHRYDILNNTYLTDASPLPLAIDDHVQAVWRDSLIYVITGWSNTTNRPNVQIYDPANDNWLVGDAVPNNNLYKSFGASGSIIGDTIYYFGGASSSGSFNVQNQLRKGVINPNDPTEISWSFSVPDNQIKGYRMASTTVFDHVHWIGGSTVTYNFDGIAYNGSGGVSPANRDLYLDRNNDEQWVQSSVNEFPMDLRGIASINDTLKFIAGGMLAGQAVSNKIYRLEWDNTTAIKEITPANEHYFSLFPNPVKATDVNIDWKMPLTTTVLISIYNEIGQKIVHTKELNQQYSFSIESLKNGIYWVEIHAQGKVFVEKLIVNK